MKRVLVPLADGFEEMEGIIIIDVLRRAGLEVTTASLKPGDVRAARGTRHIADTELESVAGVAFDMVVLPGGGEGAKRLEESPTLVALLKKMKREGRRIGAICAAPNVLRNHGILGERDRFTLHPATLSAGSGGIHAGTERVVHAGSITTSIGPGSAFEFALDLVEQLCGSETRAKVEGPLCLP